MFISGDLIFVPIFGAGYIASVEDKKIHGVVNLYYEINFVINKISILIPVFSEKAKIRRAIAIDEYETFLEVLMGPYTVLPSKWNERQHYYNDAIRNGDIFLLASVLRSINGLSLKKKLSKSEIKIFKEILGLVASELSIVFKKDFSSTKKELSYILSENNIGINFL